MMPLMKHVMLLVLLLCHLAVQAEESEKHNFPKEVADFHHVLSPLWHAPSGSQRILEICKQYPTLMARLETIAAAESPKNVSPEKWKKATKNLRQVLFPIGTYCDKKLNPEYAFANVHHGFHELVDLIGHEH